MSRPTLILDLGANNGDDLPYYLLRADLVIAVEANPKLCQEMDSRFAEAISAGRLQIQNYVVTNSPNDQGDSTSPFFIHKSHHVWSQLSIPKSREEEFEHYQLPSIDILRLIRPYLETHDFLYCKIDLEGFDSEIVKRLLRSDIQPKFLSAEVHSLKTFRYIESLGTYNAFKLVKGNDVARQYRDFKIDGSFGTTTYSFPSHSAGPFGNDVNGNWLTRHDLLSDLRQAGLGWRDIHATYIDDEKFLESDVTSTLKFKWQLISAWIYFYPRSFLWKMRNPVRFARRSK